MADKKDEASEKLLAEFEAGWGSPPPPEAGSGDRASTPDPAEIDAGWLDELFDDEDDAEPEEPEEVEPELPDERLDPVAYAEAKKARDERVEKRREKKRARAEAKKARRKARAAEIRAKQKGKQPKAKTGRPRPAAPASKAAPKKQAPAPASRDDDTDSEEPPPKSLTRSAPSRGERRGAPPEASAFPWKLVVLLAVVFLGAAAVVAMLAR